jgi:hypothetical protein
MNVILTCLMVLTCQNQAQDKPTSAIERYRKLEFPPRDENFEKGWKDRVAVEFDITHAADLKSLRAALNDRDAYVRAIAAHSLGVLGDKTAADALAALVRTDKEYVVRIRAVEALAFLKLKPEVIEAAKKDRDPGVAWVAKIVPGRSSAREPIHGHASAPRQTANAVGAMSCLPSHGPGSTGRGIGPRRLSDPVQKALSTVGEVTPHTTSFPIELLLYDRLDLVDQLFHGVVNDLRWRAA